MVPKPVNHLSQSTIAVGRWCVITEHTGQDFEHHGREEVVIGGEMCCVVRFFVTHLVSQKPTTTHHLTSSSSPHLSSLVTHEQAEHRCVEGAWETAEQVGDDPDARAPLSADLGCSSEYSIE